MQKTIENILSALRRTDDPLDADSLDRIIRARNRELRGPVRAVAKKKLLPFYQHVKQADRALWESWDIDEALEARLVRTLRMKPMRTASGVATVTVLTKPWPCSSACLYCPNDIRMPKSYLADEPACQRAERNWFDPYLQVALRLRTLSDMGHTTDKVELIVLGGTWTDYPQAYRFWFMRELFRALNEAGDASAQEAGIASRRALYEGLGMGSERDELSRFAACEQGKVMRGERTYNQAVRALYGADAGWMQAASRQVATLAEVRREHERNVTAAHRSVGLVIETRPDAIDARSLTEMRALGATKVQIGIQALDQRILDANNRRVAIDRIAGAFGLARLFGFKIHAHFMANLYRATPADDIAGYRMLVGDARFLPDEVKMYPCALVDGTGLVEKWRAGEWRPYTEDELLSVLAENMKATPPYVRVSRMIRDISSHDIMAGNKKVNLRQLVDAKLAGDDAQVEEIRTREIGTRGARLGELELAEFPYETSVSSERFLQWVTPSGEIAGFLRLSLPKREAVRAAEEEASAQASDASAAEADSSCTEIGTGDSTLDGFPLREGEAMIREVHVYGAVAAIGRTSAGAQHAGLGRKLVARACDIARAAGYARINVISAVGTREYYAGLGFTTRGLYQQKEL